MLATSVLTTKSKTNTTYRVKQELVMTIRIKHFSTLWFQGGISLGDTLGLRHGNDKTKPYLFRLFGCSSQANLPDSAR